MEVDLFLVSIVYWLCILVILIWLSIRISALKKKLVDLEKGGS